MRGVVRCGLTLVGAWMVALGVILTVPYVIVAGAFVLGLPLLLRPVKAPPRPLDAVWDNERKQWKARPKLHTWERHVALAEEAYMRRDPLDPTSTSEFVMAVAQITEPPTSRTAHGIVAAVEDDLRRKWENQHLPAPCACSADWVHPGDAAGEYLAFEVLGG